MWVLLLLLSRAGCERTPLELDASSGVSLLQLRADCEPGNWLHAAVKHGHGKDWTDEVNLHLSAGDRTKFDEVMDSLNTPDGMNPDSFLLFFGYARSGHSMVGSLLDAHPEAAVANEFDAIKAYQTGDSRERLLKNLVAVSTAYELVGRCQAGYAYKVPGVVTKSFAPGKLKVIGDKDGGCNARKQLSISELVKFQQYVGLDVSLIHVVRNPFDIVATSLAGNNKAIISRWHQQHDVSHHSYLAENPATVEDDAHLKKSLENFVDLVLKEMTYNMQVRDWIATAKLPGYYWIDVSLTEFVHDPLAQLERLCDFLGLDCEEDDYVSRAASIVRSEEHASRDELIWPQDTYDRLAAAVAQVRAEYPDGAHLWDATPPRHIGTYQPL